MSKPVRMEKRIENGSQVKRFPTICLGHGRSPECTEDSTQVQRLVHTPRVIAHFSSSKRRLMRLQSINDADNARKSHGH